jgi:hypothetical protein
MYYHKYIKYMNKSKILGGVWNCPKCTYENHDLLNNCEMCETAKTSIKLPIKTPDKLPDKLPIKTPDKLPDKLPIKMPDKLPDKLPIKTPDKLPDMLPKKLTTFYIYTTGMANFGRIETIADKWNKHVLENILQQIPPIYTEIKMFHYDPLLGIYDADERKKQAQNFNDFLNKPLKYIYLKYKKMFSINFIPDKLDIAQIESPHIIIDCAHVFRYDKMVGHVSIGDHYNDRNVNLIKLNAIYLGYFGGDTDADNMFELLARSPKLFTVNETRIVTTFIDKMIENKYAYNEDYPNDIIMDIINKVKMHAFAQIRKMYGKVNDYADKLISSIIISDKYVNTTINLIFSDIMQEDNVKILCDMFDSDLTFQLKNEKVIQNLKK